MNRYDCEAIRDLLPSLLRGEMLPHEAAAVQVHISGCADCSAEAEIVRVIQESLAPVPAELEARVLLAVRSRATGHRLPVRMAMAAALAAAVITGVFAFQRAGLTGSGTSPADLNAVSWAAAENPLLHGTSELHELSVEELELLLSELDR